MFLCRTPRSSLIWLSLRQRLIAELDRDLAGRSSRFEQYFRGESLEAQGDQLREVYHGRIDDQYRLGGTRAAPNAAHETPTSASPPSDTRRGPKTPTAAPAGTAASP